MNELECIKKYANDLFTHRYEDDGVYKLNRCNENAKKIDIYRFYIEEILEKINMASVMHLNRTVEWIKGIFDAIEADNWFSAAACLRGAMEAAADGRNSFKFFPLFLAQNKGFFLENLNPSNQIKKIVLFEDIEKNVNEFIFSANERNLKRHSEEYLKNIGCLSSNALMNILGETVDEKMKKKIIDYYGELCEITHPSGYPIRSMYHEDNLGNITLNKKYMLYGFKKLIDIFIDLKQQIFLTPVNTSLLVMRELFLLGVNPKNHIHKHYSLKYIIEKNSKLKPIQDAFGLDAFAEIIK